MPLSMPLFRRSRPSRRTCFRTPDLGTLIPLRLAAFVQAQRATIRRIEPNYAVLDIGGPTWADRLLARGYRPKVRLELTFTDAEPGHSPNAETEVDVVVTPGSRRSPLFDQMAKYVCSELRGYFAAV